MNTGGLFALHLGPVTGWAYGDLDAEPVHGSWRLTTNATDDHGAAGAALLDALGDQAKIHRPAAILMSAPIMISNSAEAADQAVLIIGLTMAAKIFAYRRGIRPLIAAREDLGRYNRDQAEAYARACGWSPKSVAAARALIVYDYGRRMRLAA